MKETIESNQTPLDVKTREFEDFASSLAGRRVFIQTHNFPDPDAIASASGLQALLRHYGIDASLCYKGSIDSIGIKRVIEEYGVPILEYGQIPDMTFDDKIILVDGQKFNANMTDLPGDEVACVDHHPHNSKCEYAYADIRPCGACSSIIARYFRQSGAALDEKTATLLLYGLQMDTDYMRRGVTELDIDAFRELFPLADKAMLRQLAGQAMRERDLRAFGKAIETIRIKDGLALARIPFACEDHLIAQVADFVLQLSEVDTAVVYSKRPDGIKFSARTVLPEAHCGNLLNNCLGAEGGGGGGHPHMAVGFLPREKVPTLYDQGVSWEDSKANAEGFRDHLAERIGAFIKTSLGGVK